MKGLRERYKALFNETVSYIRHSITGLKKKQEIINPLILKKGAFDMKGRFLEELGDKFKTVNDLLILLMFAPLVVLGLYTVGAFAFRFGQLLADLFFKHRWAMP